MTRRHSDFLDFKAKENQATSSIKRARMDYFSIVIQKKNRTDQYKLFKSAKSRLKGHALFPCSRDPISCSIQLSSFSPLTEDDIKCLTGKSSKKSCSLDPMPAPLLLSTLMFSYLLLAGWSTSLYKLEVFWIPGNTQMSHHDGRNPTLRQRFLKLTEGGCVSANVWPPEHTQPLSFSAVNRQATSQCRGCIAKSQERYPTQYEPATCHSACPSRSKRGLW